MATKTILTIITILIVIIVIAATGTILLINNNESQGITAIEGEAIANPIAKNWNTSAVLIVASKGSNMEENGEFSLWYYKYINGPTIIDSSECLEIKVYSDGVTELRSNASIGDKTPINSWIIDSDEAYEISNSQNELVGFFNHNPMLDHMSLSNSSGIPTWYIDWAYDAGFDDPKWAQIQIDANTGEVLYVEVDD